MPAATTKQSKFLAKDLVIVKKDLFPILDRYPIEQVSNETYRRIEKLACWFVLRAPMSEVTRLANPSLIDLFKTDIDPKKVPGHLTKSSLKKRS